MDSTIKTVILDLGGVYFTDGVKTFTAVMSQRFGIKKEDVEAVLAGELGMQYRTAEIVPGQFWEAAKARWNIDIDLDELSMLWIQEYVPIPGTVKLVEKLRKSGYEVLFLSDNAPDRIEYLETTYTFIGRFTGGVFSHMAKVRKPNPKIYEAVLAIASNPAAACVFIDDKERNLPPARKLGMNTLVFESPEQLEKELRQLGLRF